MMCMAGQSLACRRASLGQVGGFQRGEFGAEGRCQFGAAGFGEEAATDAVEQDLVDGGDVQAEGVGEQGDLVVERGVEEGRVVGVDRHGDARRV